MEIREETVFSAMRQFLAGTSRDVMPAVCWTYYYRRDCQSVLKNGRANLRKSEGEEK
jgi:hypothetical protein